MVEGWNGRDERPQMKKGTLGAVQFTDLELKSLIQRIANATMVYDPSIAEQPHEVTAANRATKKLKDALKAMPPDRAERERERK